MKKKDTRILWNTNTDGEISEIMVVEFGPPDIVDKNYLYDKFESDVGNASMDWENWTFEDVLIRFLLNQKFASKSIEDNFKRQLRKVDEWDARICS